MITPSDTRNAIITSRSVMPAHALGITLTVTSCCGSCSRSRRAIASQRAGHVGLHPRLSSATRLLGAGEAQSSLENSPRSGGGRCPRSSPVGAGLPASFSRAPRVSRRAHVLRRPRHAVEKAEHLYGVAGVGLLRALTCVSRPPPKSPARVHRLAPATTASPILEACRSSEHVHDGSAAGVEPRLDHTVPTRRCSVGLQLLELGERDDVLEQLLEPDSWSCRDSVNSVSCRPQSAGSIPAAPSRRGRFGRRPPCRSLFHRHHDGPRRPPPSRVDRLDRLRHHSVVGGDHDHRVS